MTESANGTVLLGLGNPILGDDGVGCSLAERIGESIGGSGMLTVLSTSLSPVRLLDEIAGHRRLVVIDSITTGTALPGTLHLLDPGSPDDDPVPVSVHHITMGQLLALGRTLGLAMPDSVKLYGVEIERPTEYGDVMSPELRERLPDIAEEILKLEFATPPRDGMTTIREESRHHESE